MSWIIAAYIPVFRTRVSSEAEQSPFGVALFAAGCLLTLALMYFSIRKARKKNRRNRK